MTDQLTHDVLTRGCAMTVDHSERLVGLLETTGHVDLSGTERVPGLRLDAPRPRDRGDV